MVRYTEQDTRGRFAAANRLHSQANMRQLSLFEAAREDAPGLSEDQLVVRVATEVVQRLDLRPPIDERLIASYHGVSRIELADIPWAGCLIPLDDGPVIRLRASDGRGRRRFTALHEVAHTFFPGFERVSQFRCDPAGGDRPDRHEELCDLAASEMLFPERWFRPDLAGGVFGIDLVQDLAGKYDASLEATAHRVVDLWPEPALLVALEEGIKPSEGPGAKPKLRVRYAHGSGTWPFVPRFKSVARDSPLEAARWGEIVEAESRLDGLASPTSQPLHVSARLFPFRDGRGVEHRRVIALYRRGSTAPNAP
jgi:hypothetical protein